MKIKLILLIQYLFFSCLSVATAQDPKNFLFISSQEIKSLEPIVKRDDIEGVQIVYSWKQLERSKGQYDFTDIENDLKVLNSLRKKLFIQIQDRSFTIENKNVPKYLLTEPIYKGRMTKQVDNPGENKPIAYGWVSMQWVPAVQQRYQLLLVALAERFDGKIYGINLPETAIGIDIKNAPAGFTCEKYFEAEIANMKFAKEELDQVVNRINLESHSDELQV